MTKTTDIYIHVSSVSRNYIGSRNGSQRRQKTIKHDFMLHVTRNLILDPLLVFLLSQHVVTIEQQGADQGSDFIQNFLTRHV